MSALLTSEFTSYIERKYIKPQDILTSILKSSPFLGLIPKDQTMGDYVDLPINYAAPAGVSPSYTFAVSNQAPGTYTKFTVQPVKLYAYGKVDNGLIRSAQAKNDKTLVLQPLNNEMARLKEALGVQMSANAMGSYGFSLGQVGTSGISTVYLTLKNVYDHIKFYKGMEICISDTNGTSGSLRDSGDSVTVTKVDRGSGILTSDENWATVISGATDNDYLFSEGSFGAGAYGLNDWIPSSAPGGSDSFCGVNRSYDTENLAGWRISATGMPIEEAVNQAAAVCAVGGAAPTVMLIHPLDVAYIMNAYRGSARPNTVQANGEGAVAKIGYRSVQVDTQLGPIDVIPDRFATRGTLMLINPDTFKLLSCGELVQFLKWDEQGSIFSTTAAGEDSTQFTIVAQWQIGCNAPGKNARITIS